MTDERHRLHDTSRKECDMNGRLLPSYRSSVAAAKWTACGPGRYGAFSEQRHLLQEAVLWPAT